MSYVNTSCFWPLSAEFETVFTTAPVFFSISGHSTWKNLENCVASITLCGSVAAW